MLKPRSKLRFRGKNIGGPLALILFGLLVAGLPRPGWTAPPTEGRDPCKNKLVMTVLDVKEPGLAVLLQTPAGKTYLLDAGVPQDGETIVAPFLKAHGIGKLDGVLITHPHGDHHGGVPYVLTNFPVRSLVLSPFDQLPSIRRIERGQIGQVHAIRRMAGQRGIPVVDVAKGSVLDWDPALQIEVLWPPKEGFSLEGIKPLDLGNDNSIVLRICYGDTVFLLPGDLEGRAAKILTDKQPQKLKADALVMPHHGCFDYAPFAPAVRPQVVITSCLLKYRQHPTPNVLPMNVVKLFGPVGARIYMTCWQGTVRVESDGRNIRVVSDSVGENIHSKHGAGRGAK